MPIYEYVCMACGQEFEAIQKFSDDPLTECMCGEAGQVERKLSLSAFQLKGGGWYKDLYSAGKANGNGGNGGNGNGTSGGDKSASDAGPAKSEGAGKSDSTSSSQSESSKSDSSKSDGGKSAGSTAASA